jgi:hypothetical protein
MLQPDSPIVVTDGSSIHFKKEYGLLVLGQQHAKLLIASKTLSLIIRGCDANPPTSGSGCNISNPVTLGTPGTPWTMTLYHTENTVNTPVTILSLASADPNEIDVQIQGAAIQSALNRRSTFGIEDPDPLDTDLPDAAALVQSNVHLAYATLSGGFKDAAGNAVSTIACPTNPPGGYCRIRINQK